MYFLSSSKIIMKRDKNRDLQLAKAPYDSLVIAAEYGDIELAKTMLKLGAGINAPADAVVTTPLYAAVCNGQLVMAKFLISQGADVNQLSKLNLDSSPLKIAILRKDISMVSYLLSQNANVNAKCYRNATALHEAAVLAEHDIELPEKFICMLLQKGADINLIDSSYGTPLQAAIFFIQQNKSMTAEVKAEHIERLKLLLSHALVQKEAKEKTIEGISLAQLSLLKSLIGAGLAAGESHEQGKLTSCVNESKVLNKGTKILYLKRAITQPCDEFIMSLDKLFRHEIGEKKRNKEYLELVRALKKINELCFNNMSKDFSRLRVPDVSAEKEAYYFKKYVKKMIHENIEIVKKGSHKKIQKQIAARKEAEKSLESDFTWRTSLNLPGQERSMEEITHIPGTAYGSYASAFFRSADESRSLRLMLDDNASLLRSMCK